jgi:hypothetical protein
VVVEFGGTTTVVLAGGGGLLLLMQPHNSPAAIINVVSVFIMSSRISGSRGDCPWALTRPAGSEGAWRHGAGGKTDVIRGLHRGGAATEAKYRFGRNTVSA